jgi:chaperonin GroES
LFCGEGRSWNVANQPLVENCHGGGAITIPFITDFTGIDERKVAKTERLTFEKLKKSQIMTLNIRPIGDRILVEAVEEKEVQKGGIIIPDTAKEKPMESRVVALGTGKTDDNGKKVPFEMKKGDRLLVARYGGTEIKVEGKEYKILRSDDVLAVIE